MIFNDCYETLIAVMKQWTTTQMSSSTKYSRNGDRFPSSGSQRRVGKETPIDVYFTEQFPQAKRNGFITRLDINCGRWNVIG